MPTEVLDLELQALPDHITLSPPHDRALVLIRYGGHPVGRAMLPATDGQIAGGDALRNTLMAAAGWPFWERWLHTHLAWQASPRPRISPPKATVAICTRDRPDDLQRCLGALMALPDDGQEVLVIDNCPSTGATQQVVSGYQRVRYVREDRLGLDIARNRALCEAHHEVVAFIDDDVVPDPGWLRALVRNFDHPLTLCVTGLTMPLELETEAQEWFETYSGFARGFRRTTYDRQTISPLGAARVGAGANMALRRSVIHIVGWFNEHLDSGTPTHSGGDTDMFARILTAGHRIVYDPAALNWHRHRRSWHELRQTLYGYGVGVYAFWTHHLLCNREVGVLLMAWQWFRHDQGPTLMRSILRRPQSVPLDLILAELRGCVMGPWAYFSSRRRRSATKREPDDLQLRGVQDDGQDRQDIGFRRDRSAGHSNPTVSVIIPTHNRRLQLERMLDALICQTFPLEQLEVIVVADGCTDDTAEMLHTYQAPFLLQVIEQPNSGPAVARNRGANRASGKILIFLDDDIEPQPRLVEAHAQLHTGRPGQVGIGYCPVVIDPTAGLFQIELRNWWESTFQQMAEPGHRFGYWNLLSGNFSLEAEMLARIGAFDPEFRFPCREDYDLGIRLIQADASFVFVPDATGQHHEKTDIHRSLWRKYEEGRADLIIGDHYPAIRPSLRLAHFLEPWSPLGRLLRALAVGWPGGGDRLASALTSSMHLIEWLRMRRYWRGLLNLVQDYWYWRGAAAGVGGDKTKAKILQAGQPPDDPGIHEIELDLGEGLEVAERRLDEEKPESACIRLGPRIVGRIPAQPGAERLQGRHLRRTLATDLAWPLVVALVGDDALDKPSLISNDLDEIWSKSLGAIHSYPTTQPQA